MHLYYDQQVIAFLGCPNGEIKFWLKNSKNFIFSAPYYCVNFLNIL